MCYLGPASLAVNGQNFSAWRVSMQLFDVMTPETTLSEKHTSLLDNVFDGQDESGAGGGIALPARSSGARSCVNRTQRDLAAYYEYMSACARVCLSSGSPRERARPYRTRSSATLALRCRMRGSPMLGELALHVRPAAASCRRPTLTASGPILAPALPEAHLPRAFILSSPATNFHTLMRSRRWKVLAVRPISSSA